MDLLQNIDRMHSAPFDEDDILEVPTMEPLLNQRRAELAANLAAQGHERGLVLNTPQPSSGRFEDQILDIPTINWKEAAKRR